MSLEAYEDLQAFVSHAKELRQSRFGQKVLAQSTVTVQTDGGFVGADEEEFRSFLLGCRLLIQNNERVSVFKIWTTCKSLMGVSDAFAPINAQRWMLNEYLDKPAPIPDHTGASLTNRQIVDTFLYGSYAHLDRTNAARLRAWQSSPRQYYPLKLMFILALKVLLQTSGAISDVIEAWISNDANAPEHSKMHGCEEPASQCPCG
jgi:hypothetical protein